MIRRLLLLGALALAAPSALAQNSEAEARALVARYILLHNSHDLAATSALYAEDAVFNLSMKRGPVRGRDAIRELEAFDIAAGSTIYPQDVAVERDGERWRVHIGGAIENSSIFAAAGVTIVMAQPIRDAFVLRDGQISIVNQPDLEPACSEAVLTALRGVSRWLAENDAERADRLLADGFVRLMPATIPGVVAALHDWRAATGYAPGPALVGRCARFELLDAADDPD